MVSKETKKIFLKKTIFPQGETVGVPRAGDGLGADGEDLHPVPIPLRPVHLRVQVDGRTDFLLT
jgi:hypothetical protein